MGDKWWKLNLLQPYPSPPLPRSKASQYQPHPFLLWGSSVANTSFDLPQGPTGTQRELPAWSGGAGSSTVQAELVFSPLSLYLEAGSIASWGWSWGKGKQASNTPTSEEERGPPKQGKQRSSTSSTIPCLLATHFPNTESYYQILCYFCNSPNKQGRGLLSYTLPRILQGSCIMQAHHMDAWSPTNPTPIHDAYIQTSFK